MQRCWIFYHYFFQPPVYLHVLICLECFLFSNYPFEYPDVPPSVWLKHEKSILINTHSHNSFSKYEYDESCISLFNSLPDLSTGSDAVTPAFC